MKKLLIILALTAATVSAKADGFVCETQDGSVRIKAYNQVQPDVGTRNPAVMVVSDPRVEDGRKTIAVFRAESETLKNAEQYLARVDLRYKDLSRGGEYLLGTRLMYVDTLALNVDFVYGDNLGRGDVVDGTLTLTKRDGSGQDFGLVCKRYLKN